MPSLILLALVLAGDNPGATAGQSDSDVYRDAQAAFSAGIAQQAHVQQAQRSFAAAEEDFLDLHRRGRRSPALYLALGNAAYLAGHWERALWAYSCGLQLAPAHALLREQRDLVRARVAYPSGSRDRPGAGLWLPLSPNHLRTVAGAAYVLLCLSATLWLLWRWRLMFALAVLMFAFLAASLFGLGLSEVHGAYDRQHPVVIVARDHLSLQLGNGPNYAAYADLPPLPRGVEARQLVRRGGWLQVQLAGGEVGWLPAAGVLIVATADESGGT